MVRQIIEIVAQFVDKASAPIRKLTNSTKQLSYQQQVIQNAAKRFGTSARYLQKELKELNYVFTEEGYLYDTINHKIISLEKGLYKAAQRAKRFKFEWLTIMFAGMALDRVFGSLIRKQFELYGVTELMGSAWIVVLQPVMDLLLPILYKLIEAFMNMPEPLKYLVGTFVLFGAILGKLAAAIGSFMLPFSLLASKGITVGQVFKLIGSKVGAFGIILTGLALIIKGVTMVIKRKFEGIGLIIAGVGAILLLFIGWWALIPIAVGAAVYLIIKHWQKVKSFFVNLWEHLKNIFSTLKNWIINAFRATADFICSLPSKILNAFKFLGRKIKAALMYILPDWMITLFKASYSFIGGIARHIRGSFQYGGVVPATGAYLLHRGETVLPAGTPVYSPNITVYANVSSSYDVRQLATQLNRYWAEDFERLIKTRGY
ncbi:MAG: hypothetical protein DRI86_11130 [Bacteroidetes bacterium]|nr:MAG: hypothetical protein DRI86_11130 [Bacteroidota bacterium]